MIEPLVGLARNIELAPALDDAVFELLYNNFDIILGPSPTWFSALYHPARTACCALLSAHACWVSIAACDPMYARFTSLDLGLIQVHADQGAGLQDRPQILQPRGGRFPPGGQAPGFHGPEGPPGSRGVWPRSAARSPGASRSMPPVPPPPNFPYPPPTGS